MTGEPPAPARLSLVAAPGDAHHRVVEVAADLTIEVSTETGARTSAHLTSEADFLRLQVEHPDVLLAAASRDQVATFAARLGGADIRIEVHGPRGRLATLEADHTSRVGALLTGSPRVSIAPAGWSLAVRTGFRRLTRFAAGRAGRQVTAGAGTAALAAVAVVAVRARRARR